MMIYPFEGDKPHISSSCFIAENTTIIGKVLIGKNSSIWFGSVVRGDVHNISIGERTNIQDMSVIHVRDGKHNTLIGSDVTVGHKALLHGCIIKNRVLIGMGALIMDGAQISEDSIVAAGSLVPPGKSYPAGVLIMGNPAKVVRERNKEEVSSIKISADKYVILAERYNVLHEV